MNNQNILRKLLCRLFLVCLMGTILIANCSNRTISIAQTTTPITGANQTDVDISFFANQTTIGIGNGALANVTITNQGVNTIGSLSVDFNFKGEYAEFSEKYSPHQTYSLLPSKESVSFNIEVMLNSSLTEGDLGADAADICLVFDSSGSMGNEIEDVKREFLSLTSRLAETIPSLRFAMIVYGWTKYSEYPMNNKNNYRDFTNDYDAINSFISELYASGGTEPWGDALYLANSFSWRSEAVKLLIIVGDENCDPGAVVGKGKGGDYYNGQDLIDAVQNLKNKGIIISSIMTDECDSQVKEQFTWLAETTGGEMIDLEELNNSQNPVTVPEIIEKITLSLAREYYINLTADISWTEYTYQGNYAYSIQKALYLVIDLAPPSISVSTIVSEDAEGKAILLVSVTPKDLSGISCVDILWIEEDLTSAPEPFWQQTTMETKIGDTYLQRFTGLMEGQPFSFYILASDGIGNSGTSEIYNITILNEPKMPGTIIEFGFLEDDESYIFIFNLEQSKEAYLWVQTNETISVTFLDYNNFAVTCVYTSGNGTIYQLKALKARAIVQLLFQGNRSQTIIALKWNVPQIIDQSALETTTWHLDEYSTNVLLKLALTDPEEGFLSLILKRSPLVAKAIVFTHNWTKMGEVLAGKALLLHNGSYYVWIDRIIRAGDFQLIYDTTPWEDSDPYYKWSGGFGIPSMTMISAAAIALLSLVLSLFRKKRKNR